MAQRAYPFVCARSDELPVDFIAHRVQKARVIYTETHAAINKRVRDVVRNVHYPPHELLHLEEAEDKDVASRQAANQTPHTLTRARPRSAPSKHSPIQSHPCPQLKASMTSIPNTT